MSFTTLPLSAETAFTSYLSANFSGAYVQETPSGNVSGTYPVYNAFRVGDFSIPAVVVSAGKFKEVEPFTHVYEGDLSVVVITQADDTADPISTHDTAVAAIYDLMSNQTGLYAAVNGTTGNFHLWSYYSTNYDSAVAGEAGERTIHTVMDFKINCQTASIT